MCTAKVVMATVLATEVIGESPFKFIIENKGLQCVYNQGGHGNGAYAAT